MKLELDGLTKEFGDFTAVNHINLTMTNGVYGLLGVNGAGKTTLISAVEDGPNGRGKEGGMIFYLGE